ncbi:hypothetical protein GS610_05450 [Ruegeria sp. HKCCD6228]|uniref:hypothetical protein n=1 Tax=Ruegeria sp. HKCCA5463 TaxID=2682994 RepID=UPI0019E8232E|nr:hypothetical protein [Ruegeria sp. HKCCA5463]NOD96649.1 hypothetical protein [Ruegeria sp. HKCCD6228]
MSKLPTRTLFKSRWVLVGSLRFEPEFVLGFMQFLCGSLRIRLNALCELASNNVDRITKLIFLNVFQCGQCNSKACKFRRYQPNMLIAMRALNACGVDVAAHFQ